MNETQNDRNTLVYTKILCKLVQNAAVGVESICEAEAPE